jgi:1-acyl-sn-glycerol-3-phosphate acyltransferase
MHQVNLFLRSLIFSIYSVVSIIFFSLLCLPALLLPIRKRHMLLRLFARMYIGVLRGVCNINYHVEGMENVPKHRLGVVFSKHQSAWETFFLPLIFHDPAVIAKRELLWIPFYGWGLAASEPILINRKDKTSAMQQIINKGKKALAAGRWILIFPEGTRMPVGEVGKYHLGGARLAVATEVLVIPVAHNAGYFWPKRKFIKQPGTIQVVIGPVIETTGQTPEAVMELAKDWIETTVTRIGGLVDKPAGQ